MTRCIVTSESPPEIAAFRASDGSPLWALPTTDVPKGNPVVSGGMLFGTDTSGEIRAYGSGATTIAAGPTPTAAAADQPERRDPRCQTHSRSSVDYDPTKLELDRPIALAIGPNGDAYVTEIERPCQSDLARRHGRSSLGQGRIEGGRVRLRWPQRRGRRPAPRSPSRRTARCTSPTATTTASRSSRPTGHSFASSAASGLPPASSPFRSTSASTPMAMCTSSTTS